MHTCIAMCMGLLCVWGYYVHGAIMCMGLAKSVYRNVFTGLAMCAWVTRDGMWAVGGGMCPRYLYALPPKCPQAVQGLSVLGISK